jgi:hypothetical protein
MSAQAASLSRTWKVGRYRAILTVPPVENGVRHACIEWAPHVPRDLTPDELKEYWLGRDRAFRELGLTALVLEV